jgi:hypothetical protein
MDDDFLVTEPHAFGQQTVSVDTQRFGRPVEPWSWRV